MATVTVEINGRPYAVGCADGQEERVRMLAQPVRRPCAARSPATSAMSATCGCS